MAVDSRSFYVYTTIEVEDEEVESRSFYGYSEIAANPIWTDTRSLYGYSNIAANPVWAGRSLYAYLNIEAKVSVLTPLEIQLLNATSWSIERILNPK